MEAAYGKRPADKEGHLLTADAVVEFYCNEAKFLRHIGEGGRIVKMAKPPHSGES